MLPLLTLLFAIGLLPIQGHNQSEYDEWLLDWEISYHADGPFAHEMRMARDDFLRRHPYGPTVEKPAAPRSLSPSPSPALSPTSIKPVRRMGNGTSDVEQWRPLVAGQFPPEQVDNALCIIRHESGGEPRVPNLGGSGARGLFQVMWTIWGVEFGFSETDFYIPELNVYAAARIWEQSGWRPWSSRHKCGL